MNLTDNRGSTPLHWACYSRAEFALNYLLSMKPDLEVKDLQGYTPLHLAIKSVGELKSTRPVRALLLKGADRDAVDSKGNNCIYMVENGSKPLSRANENDLKNMLQHPAYLECFMVKTPLVPLKPNHKTQILFVCLFTFVILSQVLIISPNLKTAAFTYMIGIDSFFLAICFTFASIKNPGKLESSLDFVTLL